MSLEVHWDRLEGLINLGLSCSTRMARLALVRMLARMCGVGGGTSPQLGPSVRRVCACAVAGKEALGGYRLLVHWSLLVQACLFVTGVSQPAFALAWFADVWGFIQDVGLQHGGTNQLARSSEAGMVVVWKQVGELANGAHICA